MQRPATLAKAVDTLLSLLRSSGSSLSYFDRVLKIHEAHDNGQTHDYTIKPAYFHDNMYVIVSGDRWDAGPLEWLKYYMESGDAYENTTLMFPAYGIEWTYIDDDLRNFFYERANRAQNLD